MCTYMMCCELAFNKSNEMLILLRRKAGPHFTSVRYVWATFIAVFSFMLITIVTFEIPGPRTILYNTDEQRRED
jgi:hypothetical protein